MSSEPTVLSLSRLDRALIVLGPVTLGVLLALALPPLARWLAGLGIALPFGFVVKAVAGVDGGWQLAVQTVIFGVLGLLVTAEILRRVTRVTVDDDEVELQTAGDRRTFARIDIGALYPERDLLILLDHDSRRMFHGEPGASRAAMGQAFRRHGYPWHDTDPFDDLYSRWEPESGQLPIEAEAVMSARAVALRKKAGAETGELRETLQKLGYAVRDDSGQQFWRPLVHR
ncbi:YqeB family protein [Actinoplanes sp. CA-015351]|uniref:YqeB family protein n=1 Tax=Actinoplanes sp. CA-015351 TaxID=3239897 RepID=UPI003D959BBD